MKAIYFDMDGTIADLYNYPNWLDCLENSDTMPYENAKPLVDMAALNELLNKFIAIGYIVGVISWSAKDGSKEYNKAVRAVKKEWINKYLPCVSEFHVVKYGTAKHTTAKIKGSILVDDNANVRKAWEKYTEENFTIDATNSEKMLINLQKVFDLAA